MIFDDPAGTRGPSETATALVSSAVPLPIALGSLQERPLVSVLIANKDYGRFLPDALNGLLAQTYPRWEAIVCDDASTDDSRSVARAYSKRDARISLVEHAVNRGQGAAFNTAFAACRGEVICFLDADDAFRPRKLQMVIDVLRRSSAGMILHPLVMIDRAGRQIQRIPGFTRFERGWIGERVARRGGRWRWVPTSGVTVRRDVAELIFPMPEQGYAGSADTFFLMLTPLLTRIAVVDDPLAFYRRHGSNHFARTRFDVGRIPSTRQNLALSVENVNERLDGLGRPGPRLRIQDNLQFLELGFQHALFNEAVSRRQLLARYSALADGLARDDLYGGLQRGWGRCMYFVAILLPARARARWLGMNLSASRPKELLRRTWRLVQGR